MATVGFKGLTLASTQHGNTLMIVNTGSISWKALCSSSWLARDDDQSYNMGQAETQNSLLCM